MTTVEAPFVAPPPEEDYIDMELTSSLSSNLFRYSIGSPPPPPPATAATRDFEFQVQMTSFPGETEARTSPADELFYKGKLLPLHLPPRLQMIQKLIHSPISQNPSRKNQSFSENFQFPFITIKSPPPESYNFSLSESCRPSCELKPDEFLLRFKEETPPRKSWSKKMKQFKQSSMAYFTTLFSKSACSNKLCSKSAFNEGTETIFENRGSSEKFLKVTKKNPFGRIDYNKWKIPKVEEFHHRKSFSGAIQSSSSSCSSSSSSLSSSFSFSSNGFSDLLLFKRSISSNSEIESCIEGAIAHCKHSQKLFESQEQTCSLSASKILARGDQKSSELCRIWWRKKGRKKAHKWILCCLNALFFLYKFV